MKSNATMVSEEEGSNNNGARTWLLIHVLSADREVAQTGRNCLPPFPLPFT